MTVPLGFALFFSSKQPYYLGNENKRNSNRLSNIRVFVTHGDWFIFVDRARRVSQIHWDKPAIVIDNLRTVNQILMKFCRSLVHSNIGRWVVKIWGLRGLRSPRTTSIHIYRCKQIDYDTGRLAVSRLTSIIFITMFVLGIHWLCYMPNLRVNVAWGSHHCIFSQNSISMRVNV